jgi:ABC-type branched-subunit amino acid transport system ATPase component
VAATNDSHFTPRLRGEPCRSLDQVEGAHDALRRKLSRSCNMAILIVEQKVREVFKIAGRVSFTGPATDLHDDAKLREVYL